MKLLIKGNKSNILKAYTDIKEKIKSLEVILNNYFKNYFFKNSKKFNFTIFFL